MTDHSQFLADAWDLHDRARDEQPEAAADLRDCLWRLEDKLDHDPAGIDIAFATANLVAAQVRDGRWSA